VSKVIAIVGSSRLGGNTEMSVRVVFDKLSENGIETELITLADKEIKNCIACDYCRVHKKCSLDDDLQPIYKKCLEADGIILGSPVYSFGPTPQTLALKTRISRLAHAQGDQRQFEKSSQFTGAYPHPSLLARKVGTAIVPARRAGASLTISVVNSFFLTNQMFLVGAGYLNIALGYQKGAMQEDAEGVRNLQMLGENMAWLIDCINKGTEK